MSDTERQLRDFHAWQWEYERERFDAVQSRYAEQLEDVYRLMLGMPALHARFTGPTPRKHYSRRERRRRRRWL